MQGLISRPELVKEKLRKRFGSRALYVALAIGAILLIVGVVVLMMPKGKTVLNARLAASAPVATVTTHRVGMSPVSTQVYASGSVAAQHSVDIGAETVGLRVTEVNVDEGDQVRRGQVLARMSSSVLQAQLSREHANLAGALAGVSKAQQPNRAEDISGLQAAYSQTQAAVSQAEANVRRAEVNLSNLRSTAARYKNLHLQGAVSVQDSQDKDTAASLAEADLHSAKQQLEAAKYSALQAKERLNAANAGGRAVDVRISQASVGQIRATIQQIEAQIAQSIIRAPSDGIITKRNAEVGEISAMGQSMFTMARGGALEFRALVQEIDLPHVRAGQALTITPAASGLKPIKAFVRELSPVVDPKTRLGTVYIDVSSKTGLKEGMYASALIESGSHLALAVPTKAVRADNTEKIVFVVDGNRVRRRPIKTGSASGDMVEVTSGLSAGEQIVIAGAGFLKDGDVVTVSTEQG